MKIEFINFETKNIILEKEIIDFFVKPNIEECIKINNSIYRVIDIEYLIDNEDGNLFKKIVYFLKLFKENK